MGAPDAVRRHWLAVTSVFVVLVVPADVAAGAAPQRARPEVPVTSIDLAFERAQNSPALAVDPQDSRFLALASRVDGGRAGFGCALHLSGDAGRSWQPAAPVPALPAGAERCYAPEIAFDRSGRLYFLFVGLQGRGNTPMGVFLTSSADRGRTFAPPRRLLGPHRYQVRMALDPESGHAGRIHLVWLQPSGPPSRGGLPAGPNPIMAAHSDDGGRTLSDPVRVSDPARQRVVAPALALGGGGAVHVAYYDLEEDAVDYQGLEGPTWPGTWTLAVASSDDGGERFSRRAVIAEELVPPERVMLIFTMPPPSLAVSPSNTVHAAWWDARNGDWDVYLARSGDGGRHWTGPQRLNDDAPGNGRHQYLPRLAVAPDGRLDAIFYDRRDDPENVFNHVYFTSSADGGRHFTPNIRLTTTASKTTTGARYLVESAKGLVEFGSRLALLSRADGALAAWTDTRLPQYGRIHQDIFATEVVVEAPGGGPAPGPILAVALGAGLVVVGGMVGLARRRRRPADGQNGTEAGVGDA